MENAFPQKPFWRQWARCGSPLCVCGSALGLFGLLASHGSGLARLWRSDHVRVMQRVAGPEALSPTRSQQNPRPMVLVGTRFSIGLLMQPGNRAGQLDPVVRPVFPAALVVRWKTRSHI
jgi:hypothetical protein